MVDPDGTINSTNTGTSVTTHSTANPTNNTITDTIDANITDTTEFHQDVATDPGPTIAAPPTAEHISSFLLHIRQRATDTAGDPALSAATPADTADDTSRGHTNDPDDDTPAINVDIASTVDITADIDDATMTVDHGADAQPNGDTSVVPVG